MRTSLILTRYIIREIIAPLLVMLAVLLVLFAVYCTTHYLEDAVYGLMPVDTVIKLVALKLVTSLEVLIPSCLYLSVIIGLGRLYKDGEITALFSSGIGLGRLLTVVLCLSLAVSILVAVLSLWVRPWAYEKCYRLKARAKAEFDVTLLKPGRFYKIGRGKQVIFIDRIDQQRKKAQGVFMEKDRTDENGLLKVMYAKEALQYPDPATGIQKVLFLNGHSYKFPNPGKGGGSVMEFRQLALSLWPKEINTLTYKKKAASTVHLSRSQASSDIAELQWRLFAPLSAILLPLLGIPLSRTTAREGKYAKLVMGLFVYALYYSMATMARIFVEQERIPPFPGIWWVQGLLVVLILVLLVHPSQQFGRFRGIR
ncbi:MAG: LPS export ABC transporter permease LptF [Deltaproteobacteria bacterium]|nr:MAG: LPS export ABC transporter permease LptF [Deltaproteobacteria bacterium]